MNVEGFATFLWLLLFISCLIIVNLIFFFVNFFSSDGKQTSSAPNIAESEGVEFQHQDVYGISGVGKPDPREMEEDVQTPLTNDEMSGLETVTTKYAFPGGQEIVHNDYDCHRLYSTCLDDTNIKVSTVWSLFGNQVDLAYSQNDRDFAKKARMTSIYNVPIFSVQTKTVPLSTATYLEAHAIQFGHSKLIHEYFHSPSIRYIEYGQSLFLELKNVLIFLWNVFIRGMGFWAFLTFTVALVVCFYVPGYMETSAYDTNNYNISQQLTQTIFAFTIICFLFHSVYLILCVRSRSSQSMVFRWSIFAFILLLCCIVLSGTLLGVSVGALNSNSGSSSSSSSSSTGSWNIDEASKKFSCMCTDDTTTSAVVSPFTNAPTAVPTATPTAKPTISPTFNPNATSTTSSSNTDTFSFECTSDILSDANGDICRANCGVCSLTYRGPFITYTIFASFYFLFMICLIHYELYFQFQIDYKMDYIPKSLRKPPPVPLRLTVSELMVTIHGSKAFGYPLKTKMNTKQYLQFEQIFNALVTGERLNKKGDFMVHLKEASG